MQKLAAIVLAAALMLSLFSEAKLYAASYAEEEASSDMSEDMYVEMSSEASSETPEGIEDGEEEPGTLQETEPKTKADAEIESKPEAESYPETETAGEAASDENDEAESYEKKADSESESAYEIMDAYPVGLEPENTPYDENQEEFTYKLLYGKGAAAFGARNAAAAPRYDAREENYLPAVRNQGSWGACWSFSLLGAMEAAMVRDMGVLADKADLSERHLAYFGFNTGYDALDNANGDTMTCTPENYYLTNGGNDLRGVMRLMNWNGGAAESDYPYSVSTLPDKLDRTNAQDAELYIENAHRYDFAEAQKLDKAAAVKVVKKMIADYGAVSWSYYSAAKYLGGDGKSYYNYEARPEDSPKTNHAVMAVGWDDNYARENFAAGHQPQNNGAWIIRNSYGNAYGENGYIYISYEDVSLGSANPVYAVTACDASKYDNNYFYTNTAYAEKTIAVRRAAQVYKINGEKAGCEKLAAVSLLIAASDVDYKLQLYKNPDMQDGIVVNPESGTPMLDTPQTGTLGYAGLHTIELNVPVRFDADDIVSVVITFPNTKPGMYFDRSYTADGSRQKGTHVIKKGQSFYSSSLAAWKDNYGDDRTFRINMLTVDEVHPVELLSAAPISQENGKARVKLLWNAVKNAQSYEIYRSAQNVPDAYERIAGIAVCNDAQEQYIDNTPQPETSYNYKVIVTVNNLSSTLENTNAAAVTTKPVLSALAFEQTYMEIEKDTQKEFSLLPTPANCEYEQELAWSAYDDKKNPLEAVQENDAIIINGTDGKSICRIAGNKIYAVNDSETYRFTLTARTDNVSAGCDVFVYSNNLWVSGVKKEVMYTGEKIEQNINVYDGKRLLTKDVDYTLAYRNNLKVSANETNPARKPQIIIKGKGSYTGTQTLFFEILPEPLSDAEKILISKAAVSGIKTCEYKGEPVTPKPVVKYGRNILEEGRDYELSYKGSDYPGTAQVIIKGINDYKGTKTVSFRIYCDMEIVEAEIAEQEFASGTKDVPYAKGGAKPSVMVRCNGRLLAEGTDYRLSYRNNNAAASADGKKAPTVIITGRGSYRGRKEIPFSIGKQNIRELSLTARDKVYAARAGNFVTSFVITDKDGRRLSPGRDYDKASVTYKYADTEIPVQDKGTVPAGTTLVISVNAAEKGAYYGTISGKYRIASYDIGKAKISVANQEYTGGKIEPDSGTGVAASYRDKGGLRALKEGEDYEIIGYDNNEWVGTAVLHIRGIGSFCGTRSVKFRIKAKAFKWWRQ